MRKTLENSIPGPFLNVSETISQSCVASFRALASVLVAAETEVSASLLFPIRYRVSCSLVTGSGTSALRNPLVVLQELPPSQDIIRDTPCLQLLWPAQKLCIKENVPD